jgi:hypothetical protein
MVEALVGCSHSYKDPPRETLGTILAQVGCQRFSNIVGQREAIANHPFPSYLEFSDSPVDIVQFHGDHLSGSKSEPGQEKKHRMIPPPDRGGPITAVEKVFDLLELEVFRHIGQPPSWDGQYRIGEVTFRFLVFEEEPEEGSKSNHHQLGDLRCPRVSTPEEKTADILGTQLSKPHGTVAKAVDEKTPDTVPVPASRHRGDPTFLREIIVIPILDHSQRRLIHFGSWTRNEAFAPEMIEETTEGEYIAVTTMCRLTSVSEKTINNLFRQVNDGETFSFKPCSQFGQHP